MACWGPQFSNTLLNAAGGPLYMPATPFHRVLPNGRHEYAVKFIGPYLSDRLASAVTTRHPAGIHTVADLRAECAGRSRRAIERIISDLMANARPNRCVADSYHTSLVNTCGFNTVLALLRVNNAEARRIPFRERGPAIDQGQRTCSCLPMGQCIGNCRWTEGACIPAIHIPLVSEQGFGPDGARARVAGQYRRTAGHAPRGRRYVQRWLIPTNPPLPPPPPPPPVIPPPVPIAHRTRARSGPRRSGRIRRLPGGGVRNERGLLEFYER